jgi:DUF4097 and DUF4098 domain-containing protein YvlB
MGRLSYISRPAIAEVNMKGRRGMKWTLVGGLTGFSLLLVPAALVAQVKLAASATDVFQRSLPLPPGGTFSLKNINGSVQVEAWERPTVEIRAVKTAHRDAADLSRVQIVVDAQPGEVAVRTQYPEGDGVEVSVDYRVRVPYRVFLKSVQTVNGTLRVRGVEGNGSLLTVNGNVHLTDAAGRFNARTTNGNIEMEFRRLPAGPAVAIEAVNGSVLLALPESADAELDVRSMNGDFRSELPVVLHGAQGTREFRGTLGRGGGEVRVRTVNGGIRVVAARPTI